MPLWGKRSARRAHQGSIPRPVANCLVPPVSRPIFSQMMVRLPDPEVKRQCRKPNRVCDVART